MSFFSHLKNKLLFLCALVAAFFFVLNLSIVPISKKVIGFAAEEALARGIEIKAFDFKSAYLSLPHEITWRNIDLHFKVTKKEDIFVAGREFIFKADKVSLKIKNLNHRKFGLHLSGLYLSTREDGHEQTSDYLTGEDLELKFFFDFLDPKAMSRQVESWAKGFQDIAETGRTLWPVEFSGAVYVDIHDRVFKIRISVREDDYHQYGLVMDKEDLRSLAKSLQDNLTEPEIELISRNPLRAPEVMRVSSYAAIAARAAAKKERTVDENCYRHVIWSYLLAKKFGADFARQVAEAHEAGRVDVEGDREVDMRNNSVGRRYAVKGYTEESILGRLLKDKHAIINDQVWKKIKADRKARPPQKTVPPPV